LAFWHLNKSSLNKLVHPALKELRVPVASSAFERVFSHGGVILSPYHARMSDSFNAVPTYVSEV